MVTHSDLVALTHSLRSERVLSVYLDPSARNPASKGAWRVQLDHSLKEQRASLVDSPHHEREQFERCVTLLLERLPDVDDLHGPGGWVAFITSGGVVDAERLPVPTPTLAVWSTGIFVAPYVRALKESRPVVVLVADARKASIYRYVGGRLEHVETLRAHATVEPTTHMGGAPRNGFHPGVRGSTGRDNAQRALAEGTERMLLDAADRAARLAAPDGWVVVGGIPRVAAQMAALLAKLTPGRVVRPDSLDIHASHARIAAAARAGASALRNASDLRRLEEAIALGGESDLVALGPAETQKVLEQARVRELYFTHRYLSDHPPEVEGAVRAALEQDALVEEVSGEAARRLDEHGGVAARLRYRSHAT
jgi:hypothetical protein